MSWSKVCSGLTARERDTLERFFGLQHRPEERLTEIAKTYGVTRQAMQKTKRRALEKIASTCGPAVGRQLTNHSREWKHWRAQRRILMALAQ